MRPVPVETCCRSVRPVLLTQFLAADPVLLPY